MSGPQPVPPPPMFDALPRDFRLVALPWITAVYVMFPPLVVNALGCIILTVSHSGLPLWVWMESGIVLTVGCALFGLGMAASDRVLPRWPRALRWALGMAATGVVPIHQIYLALTGQAVILMNLMRGAIGTAIGGVIMGLLLGLAARRRERLHLRMGVAGGALGLVLLVPMVVAVISGANAGQGSPVSLASLANVAVFALLPVLLALILARTLTRADQREPAD